MRHIVQTTLAGVWNIVLITAGLMLFTGLFIGPALLADTFSPWWIALYTPYVLVGLYIIGKS